MVANWSGELPPAPGNADTAQNVEGRRAQQAPEGFGQLWRKVLTAPIQTSDTPESVLRYWKEHLHELWPDDGEFYQPLRGIKPGEVAGIDLSVGPMRLSTGVVVVHADDHSFTVRAPDGHMFAGSNRFSVEPAPDGVVAKVTIVFRASDPLYELGLVFGGHRAEELFWAEMLRNLAGHYGQRPSVHLVRVRLDSGRRWRNAANIRENAAILTTLRRIKRLLPPFRDTAN